jgi:hypothetical protein
MTRLLLSITLLVLLSVSCGIAALPPENASKTTVQNVTRAKKPPIVANLPTGTPYDLPSRQLTVIDGVWNIRSSPSLGDKTQGDNITGKLVRAGDVVTVTGSMVHGWYQIGADEWICNQAVQGTEECK